MSDGDVYECFAFGAQFQSRLIREQELIEFHSGDVPGGSIAQRLVVVTRADK